MTADPTMFAALDHTRTRTQPKPGRRWLDRGELACAGCGRAVPAGHDAAMTATEIILDSHHPRLPDTKVTFGRCAACAGLDVHSRLMAGADDPALARALIPFRVLGLPLPARITAGDVRRWLGRFSGLDWASRVLGGEDWRTCTAEAWAHVDAGSRAALVETMARWAYVRARPGRPVRIPPPEGRGCAMCGRSHVEVPASEAHSIAPDALWRRLSVDRSSLGGQGGQRARGSLCVDCVAAATDEHDRLVIGPSSLETALAAWWESHGEPDAARWVRQGEFAGVVGWLVSGADPGEPWSHMAVPVLAETVGAGP